MIEGLAVGPEDRVGTVLAGKYRLEGILGQGAMGTVYRGTHELTRRPVAVKMLHDQVADDAMTRQRLLREAQAAARLKHPNVVDVLDMGEVDGVVYLVLEVLEGESLEDRLVRGGKMSPRETFSLLLPVLGAVERAHGMGIVHRDIKPDNIFLHEEEGALTPKLLDFGIAKHLDRGDGLKTASGTILGTPEYMAPEQASGDEVLGPGADVWSAGVVLFECLSGTLPFDGKTRAALMFAVVSQDAPALESRAAEIPVDISRAVDRALSREIADRYASMDEMLAALRSALAASGVELADPAEVGHTVRPAPPAPARSSSRLPLWLGAAVVVGAVLAALLLR